MDTDVFFFSLPLVVPSQGLPLLVMILSQLNFCFKTTYFFIAPKAIGFETKKQHHSNDIIP